MSETKKYKVLNFRKPVHSKVGVHYKGEIFDAKDVEGLGILKDLIANGLVEEVKVTAKVEAPKEKTAEEIAAEKEAEEKKSEAKKVELAKGHTEESLLALKVPELKEIAAVVGVEAGKKADMVEGILAEAAKE